MNHVYFWGRALRNVVLGRNEQIYSTLCDRLSLRDCGLRTTPIIRFLHWVRFATCRR
jgi:hypothetical protein